MPTSVTMKPIQLSLARASRASRIVNTTTVKATAILPWRPVTDYCFSSGSAVSSLAASS